MSKILITENEFYMLTPLLLLVAMKNPESVYSEDLMNFLDDVKNKIKAPLRQYYRAVDPNLRRKLRFLLDGLELGQNAIISIAGSSPNESCEKKYLKESWVPMDQLIKKYL